MFGLGNFSGYSFYGAAWDVATLVRRLAAAGYRWAGLADMGSFAGGVPFSQACASAGLHPVFGCRLSLPEFAPGWVQLTARDADGYTALCRLISETAGHEVDWEALADAVPALAGHVWISCPVRVESGRQGRVGDFLRWRSGWERLREVCREEPWLELGWQSDEQHQLQQRVYADLQRSGWTRWVMMTAARHDGSPQAARLLELLQAIGTLTRLGQRHPDKLPPGEYGLMPAPAFMERFQRVPDVLESTRAFVDGCRFDYGYGRLYLPNPLVRTGDSGEELMADRPRQNRLLAWRCLRGLVRRYGAAYPWPARPTRAQLLERLRRELSIVAETGYAGYFLVFAEVIDACRARGISVLARGSAAGSLICHALGVSNVCPFRFGLSFERFLNRERMRHSKLPDIDLDLPWDRREEIMQWIHDRYGVEHVAMIGGFACFKGRASVVEVAKTLGVPPHEAHAWSRRLPHGSLRSFLQHSEDYVEAAGAWQDARFRETLEMADGLHDLPRHSMMHPCGMVISSSPLTRFTPVLRSASGFPMTQMAMDPVEDLGLLKMDLLGQAGISVLRDCTANLAACGEEQPFAGMDFGDSRIYKWIQTGGARGVFHIESPAMTSLLALCRCGDIDCLVATVSVIRPGAANEDKKTRFARRYLGLEAPRYAHPTLEEPLRDTFGLMVYEEQILFVANRFAGMDFGTADLLRRILIKKADGEAMEELQAVFEASARHNGRNEAEIAVVWAELRDFSGFMFNKAHGAAYAIEAFRGCWLKYHWPVHFLAAVLNNRRGFYAPIVYVVEILRHNGQLVLPDVQWPGRAWEVAGDGVRIPLWQIKGLGEAFLARWERARKGRPFRDWEDFLGRARPSPAEALALARAGALAAFFPERHEAIWQTGRVSRHAGMEGPDLFAASAAPRPEGLPPMDARAMAAAEAELLGFPVTIDPFAFWLEDLDRQGTVPVARLPELLGREVEVAGLQVCHRLHRTLQGGLMKFISIADASGIAETVLFPDMYRQHGWALSQSRACRLRVLVEPDETGSGLSLTVTDARVN